MDVPQSVLDRIQKLLNLSEGAESVGSLHEAENAAAKAQQLLMQYNLDLETVKASTIAKKAEMFDGFVDLSGKQDKRESFWVPKLYGAIARNNMSKVFVRQQGVWIIGHADNVQLILYIAEQMISKVRIAEKYGWRVYEARTDISDWQREKRGTWRRGFFEGAAHGIDQKLQREMDEYQMEKNPFAVMIIHKKAELDEYWQDKYVTPYKQQQQERADAGIKTKAVKLRKGPKGLSSQHGWRDGYDSGLKMNINKGMDNSQPKGHIS